MIDSACYFVLLCHLLIPERSVHFFLLHNDHLAVLFSTTIGAVLTSYMTAFGHCISLHFNLGHIYEWREKHFVRRSNVVVMTPLGISFRKYKNHKRRKLG
jgi:hypothetical protein